MPTCYKKLPTVEALPYIIGRFHPMPPGLDNPDLCPDCNYLRGVGGSYVQQFAHAPDAVSRELASAGALLLSKVIRQVVIPSKRLLQRHAVADELERLAKSLAVVGRASEHGWFPPDNFRQLIFDRLDDLSCQLRELRNHRAEPQPQPALSVVKGGAK